MAKARRLSADTRSADVETPERDLYDRDRIALRAYELYLARGGTDGADFDDWLAAERELAASNGEPARDDADEAARGDAGE
jgi:hypothetical protein